MNETNCRDCEWCMLGFITNDKSSEQLYCMNQARNHSNKTQTNHCDYFKAFKRE